MPRLPYSLLISAALGPDRATPHRHRQRLVGAIHGHREGPVDLAAHVYSCRELPAGIAATERRQGAGLATVMVEPLAKATFAPAARESVGEPDTAPVCPRIHLGGGVGRRLRAGPADRHQGDVHVAAIASHRPAAGPGRRGPARGIRRCGHAPGRPAPPSARPPQSGPAAQDCPRAGATMSLSRTDLSGEPAACRRPPRPPARAVPR